jgi:hypothetical protein
VEKFRSGGDELATVGRWPNAFDELHTRVARRFLRPEVRERVRASAGAGSKGDRLYDWSFVSLPEPEAPGAGRWLLVGRSIGDPTELAYYLA